MKFLLALITSLLLSATVLADDSNTTQTQISNIVWQQGVDIEKFWQRYVKANGGLTWQESTEYPDYSKVSEGDTFLVKLPQGTCLMEFFHSRWRRANDVRRWDDSVNEYGACPYVFD